MLTRNVTWSPANTAAFLVNELEWNDLDVLVVTEHFLPIHRIARPRLPGTST